MKILRHESDLDEVEHLGIRDLIQSRIEMIEEEDFFDADVHGQFVIAEPGDSIEALEAETFRPLLGDPPCFESALDHDGFFDLVWALAGDQCVTLIVPKQEGVPTSLLALCERYASSEAEPPDA